MATQKDYTSDSIKNLSFPHNVRHRPGMYIGSTDASGIQTILREVLDNTVDECLEGHCSEVDVILSGKDFTVIDNGRGIPRGKTEVVNQGDGSKTMVPTIRAVFGVLSTSGKYSDEAYKVSRGVHGVGVKSTNALSQAFKVSSFHTGKWLSISFRKGVVHEDVSIIEAPKHPATGKSLTKGTIVKFRPDPEIFEDANLSKVDLFNWSRMAAYFTPGYKINLYQIKADGQVSERSFSYPEGPKQYVEDRITELRKASEFGLLSEVFFHSTSTFHDCVIKFTSYDGCDVRGFTNGLLNIEGGFHLTSLLTSLKDSLTPFLTKKQNFTINELKDGLVGCINIKLSGPKFDSQTKEKLVDERAAEPLKKLLLEEFAAFFKKNKSLATGICERATKLKDLKSRFVASKQMLTALKKISKKGFPAKAATSPKCKPHERELYLLEGDSAAGGGRFARDEYYQEFLPMKGKCPNILRLKKGAEIVNEEILNIFAMLGFDPRQEDPYDKLRVGKIIIMSDSDADGPLIGSTKVKMADGSTRAMEELAADWIKNGEPFKLKSLNENGEIVDAEAVLPMEVAKIVTLYTVELSNGNSFECTGNHCWPVTNLKEFRVVAKVVGAYSYVSAENLRFGDILPGDVNVSVKNVTRKYLPNPEPVYCLAVPKYGNFLIEGQNGVCTSTGNSHISSLLLGVFYKYLPELFEKGMIYVTRVPEYYAVHKDIVYSGNTLEETQASLNDSKVSAPINHLKGYGECPSDLLKIFAFEPTTRSLYKVSPCVDDKFELLMSNDSSSRKILLNI